MRTEQQMNSVNPECGAGRARGRDWLIDALSSTPPPFERRELTLMFADLVGSTALSERLEPEELREVLNGFRRCCESNTEHFGGFVARYMGDAVLVYFGYPRTARNDAERAVLAGLSIVEAVASLDLHARVGIATGEVLLETLTGTSGASETVVIGQAPNLAARLQSLAAPDSIVIAESTYRRTGPAFRCVDLGPSHLKGFSRPARAWQVAGRAPVPASRRLTDDSRAPRQASRVTG